jgi:tagatose 6-phosphate kinase
MILCLGTTPTVQRTMTFAHLRIDEVNRAATAAMYASGKSINVARVLHQLGKEVLATGFLGGESGKFIRNELDREGIAHDFVDVSPNTRQCTTLLDQSAGTATELVEESAAVDTKAYVKLLREFDANLWRARVIVLSGSMPPEAPEDFYAQCVAKAASQNIPVVLDTRGGPLTAALSSKPFVVKPNREELSLTVGSPIESDEDLRAAMKRIVQMGATWAVITLGKDGAMASDGKNFWRIHSPAVKALNAVGSGDSFAAGLAAGISSGEPVPQACALAAACGAANAITLLAGHVDAGVVKMLREQASVESV